MIPELYGESGGQWYQHHDREHAELLLAFEAGDARLAKRLVEADWHRAWAHWQPLLAQSSFLAETALEVT